MLYKTGIAANENWMIAEEAFIPQDVRKYESIMCLGNGYMGVRAAAEECYPKNNRYALVAGTFDKYEDKQTELPNFADVVGMAISVNGDPLDLTTGEYSDYMRTLNLKNGLLKRSFIWKTPSGKRVQFKFERFVSLADKHLLASKVSIQPLSAGVSISIETGIDGRDRYGNPHFMELEKNCEKNILQYCEITKESRIPFIISTVGYMYDNGRLIAPGQEIISEEMYIAKKYSIQVKQHDILSFEKLSNVFTMRDLESDGMSVEQVKVFAIMQLKNASLTRFDQLQQLSALEWQKIWGEKDVIITSRNNFDQLALRFAVYHLTIMAPIHDSRMSIGAKGLTGKGYMGHSFWDTEIFILPFFIFTDPKGARSLLEYRYHTLYGARKKATEYGYEGAMYPWESAWITDSEVTPSSDLMGPQEHHITADIAYSIYYYYCVTGDDDFMEQYGYEIIFETAKFWQSRVSYNALLDRYEIIGVIGPDEFTHDADNNAFTNYMAYFNLKLAVCYYELLKAEHQALFGRMNQKLKLDNLYEKIIPIVYNIYLPRENKDMLVPQDDTYLTLPEVDLTPYRTGVKKLRQDYKNLSYSKLQVSKQADVMVLFLLLEDMFSQEVKRKNFHYYEARCVHESSLSLCSYSILAADVHEKDQSYALYERACRIDLGSKMDSSNDGIHAASLGGIWQCSVFGFLGIRLYGDQLRIQPNLPKEWSHAETNIIWKGQKLYIEADKEKLHVKIIKGNRPATFIFNHVEKTLSDEIVLIK